jgi:hypothetical protein
MSLRKLSLIAVTISLCTLSSAMENSNQPQPSPTPTAKSAVVAGLTGAIVAKSAVSMAGHGLIGIVSLGAGIVGGPAAGYGAFTTLETFFGPSIEIHSYQAAIVGAAAGASFAEKANQSNK